MGSKRGKKAKKRAQREARRERRRAHSAGGDDHQQAHARQQPASPIITAPAELASYMVSPREAHGQTRRARHATQETTRTTDLPPAEKIGYMAYDGHDFLRKNGECIVAASAAQMQRTATHVFPDTRVVIRGLTFEETVLLKQCVLDPFRMGMQRLMLGEEAEFDVLRCPHMQASYRSL